MAALDSILIHFSRTEWPVDRKFGGKYQGNL